MILVEPRVFESMQQQQQQQQEQPNHDGWDATSSNLREKDKSIQDILESDQNIYDKANAYQQALWGFLNRFDQYKDRPLGRVQLTQGTKAYKEPEVEEPEPEEAVAVNSVEQDVVASAPQFMKNKATRLLQRLKSDPEVKWNDRGEFEYRGQLIKNSNLTDLVNDVLRDRKRKREPRGWETFAEALQRLNVPQDLIGNPARWSFISKQTPDTVVPATQKKKKNKKQKKGTRNEDDDDADDERFSTPFIETPKKLSRKKMRRTQKWNQLFT